MEALLPIFADRLRILRKEQKMTQKAMAVLLDKTERHYQAIEAGTVNISATTLIFLSQYFHVSTDYLLGLKDER